MRYSQPNSEQFVWVFFLSESKLQQKSMQIQSENYNCTNKVLLNKSMSKTKTNQNGQSGPSLSLTRTPHTHRCTRCIRPQVTFSPCFQRYQVINGPGVSTDCLDRHRDLRRLRQHLYEELRRLSHRNRSYSHSQALGDEQWTETDVHGHTQLKVHAW